MKRWGWLVVLLGLSGCASLSNLDVAGLAPNPTDCAIFGTVLPAMLGITPLASAGPLFGAIAGADVCKAGNGVLTAMTTKTTISTASQTVTQPAAQPHVVTP
jgi:hypothetical protein